MKNSILTLLGLFLFAGSGIAQAYDDLYYDPSRATKTVKSRETVYTDQSYDDNSYQAEDDYYLDDEDYDYYYASRIRRFHRPLYGFDFFDPFYVDMSYYDPFYNRGMTVLIYDDPYSYRSIYRRNFWRNSFRYNSWAGINPYRSPFGWNSWNTWSDPWFSPYRSGFSFSFGFGTSSWYNRSFYNPYGFASPFYFTPSWGYGYNYNTFNNVTYNVYNDVRQKEVYYGPRSNAATNVPRSNSPRMRSETPGEQTDRALGRKSYSDSRTMNPNRGSMDRGTATRNNPDINSPNINGRTNPRATGRSNEINTRRNPSAVNPSEYGTSRSGSIFDRSRSPRSASPSPSRVNPGTRQQSTPNVYRPGSRTPGSRSSSGFNSSTRTQPQRSNMSAPRMSAPRTGSPASRPSISTPSRPNVGSSSATKSSGGSRKKND